MRVDYHRRITEPKDDKVATLCGQRVNYQEACSSLTNVGCPKCIAAADTIVNQFVRDCQETIDVILAKPGRAAGS